MAFYDDDFDEDLLVEIPCEFCNDPFPILFLTEHQTGCRYDLVRVNEPTVEEIEEEFTAQEERETRDETISQFVETQSEPTNPSLPKENIVNNPVKKISNIFSTLLQYIQTPIEPKNGSLPKENAPSVKESSKQNQNEKDFHEYEVLEEDLLEVYETSFKNKEKRVEEKPSFKVATIPVLANSDSKSLIPNELPDSDNEETETLEQLWEKAKIILAQRSRVLKGKII